MTNSDNSSNNAGGLGLSFKDMCMKCASCTGSCTSIDVRPKLEDAGIRITRQRVELAQLLFRNGDRHFTADALYEEALSHNIPVSLATIYNTLQSFVTAGLIRRLAIDDDKAWYDTNVSEHHHLFFEDENCIYDIADGNVSITKMPDIPEGMEVSRVEVVVRLRRCAR
ncbi:MAG: transcriptional repressor [Proteobacteria bacterium]|nr:transcriptional repressor [Pseudomonadota bacterium]